MADEFHVIDQIVAALGEQSHAPWVSLGPGDDAAVGQLSAGCEWVASVDTLVEGVHFPEHAPGELVGYRSLMVSLSDLAAMGASPVYVLVALTLPDFSDTWVIDLARGMARAGAEVGVPVVGGNLARGPLTIAVSVHGEVPAAGAVTRSGAQAGDGVYVTGALGSAAACVRLEAFTVDGALSPLQKAYYQPRARLDLSEGLRNCASAAVDISDGLLADAAHLAQASGVDLDICREDVPLGPQAAIADALGGGDDYEVLFTSAQAPQFGYRIGTVLAGSGLVRLDGTPANVRGYNHGNAGAHNAS